MTLGKEDGQDLLEQAHLALLRGQLPQARRILETMVSAQSDNQTAQELLSQVIARQDAPPGASAPIYRPSAPRTKNPLHTLAVLYGNWLTAGNGESGRTPPIILLLVFCPMALLYAAMFGVAPAISALHHGVPLNGYIQERTRHGGMETESVHSLVTYSVVTFIICIPLLLSSIAFLLGWYGRPDGDDAA